MTLNACVNSVKYPVTLFGIKQKKMLINSNFSFSIGYSGIKDSILDKESRSQNKYTVKLIIQTVLDFYSEYTMLTEAAQCQIA